MTYRLSRAADHDLYTLYLDGLKKHGLLQADSYYDELLRTLDILAGNPEMARVRYELRPPVRIHPHKEHLIIYDIDESGDIFIVRIPSRKTDWLDVPN